MCRSALVVPRPRAYRPWNREFSGIYVAAGSRIRACIPLRRAYDAPSDGTSKRGHFMRLVNACDVQEVRLRMTTTADRSTDSSREGSNVPVDFPDDDPTGAPNISPEVALVPD